MADHRKEEARALSRDERELAQAARYPRLGRLTDADLQDLILRLRERRDRARSIANRQRREIRGKAEPAGSAAVGADAGSHSKLHFLNCALRRAQDEVRRRDSVEDLRPGKTIAG
ncbi:hypothetical protein ACFQXB_02545 [Plastorhodobacter daqingensis]|uniref:Uncharacterized protein n=1 Tax=Plastorhodobacter daqingensis TaxID=1387281 RepID=A0ABW2UHX9_9RHOB